MTPTVSVKDALKYNDMLPKKSKVEKIIDIKPSKKPLKKYDAFVENNETKRVRVISFGQKYPDGTPYEQFKDKIGFYKKYDHNDEERRQRYLKRHSKYPKFDEEGRYTASYFADYFLW